MGTRVWGDKGIPFISLTKAEGYTPVLGQAHFYVPCWTPDTIELLQGARGDEAALQVLPKLRGSLRRLASRLWELPEEEAMRLVAMRSGAQRDRVSRLLQGVGPAARGDGGDSDLKQSAVVADDDETAKLPAPPAGERNGGAEAWVAESAEGNGGVPEAVAEPVEAIPVRSLPEACVEVAWSPGLWLT